MRTREQTEFRDPEEASSSGRYHTQGSVRSVGKLIPHVSFTGAMPGSGLPEGKYPSMGSIDGLYHKVNNHYELLSNDFNVAIRNGFIYGAIIDGYIRPLYNKNGQIIVVSQETHKKIAIAEHEIAAMGYHRHFSQVYKNLPSVPPA